MDAVSRNLRALIEHMGVKQGTLARIAGVSDGSVSFWLSGKVQPRIGALEKIASYYGISVDELTSDDGLYEKMGEAAMPGSIVKARISRAYASLHDVVENTDYPKSASVPECMMERHPNAYYVEADGDCMDKVFPSGCLVLVDPDSEPQNGSIAAVSINGGACIVRRMYRGSNALLLVADSHRQYEDIVVSNERDVKVYGTVV